MTGVAGYATDSSCSFSPLGRCCDSGRDTGLAGAKRCGGSPTARPRPRAGSTPGATALQPVNQRTSGPSGVSSSNNMQLCYGNMTKIGPDSFAAFDVPWWWRTDFTPNLAAGQTATLIVNGVVGSANVWVNGTEV